MKLGTLLMIAAAVVAAALAAADPAAAQQAAPSVYKVGFVSMDRVLRDSRASQQVQKSMEAEMQKRLKEIEAGPKADMDRRKIALADDMNVRREIALNGFMEKMNGIIRRIAEAEKFDAVFIEAIYVDVRIDITDRIIKALDAGS